MQKSDFKTRHRLFSQDASFLLGPTQGTLFPSLIEASGFYWFASNQVRLAMFVLAKNIGNFILRFALPIHPGGPLRPAYPGLRGRAKTSVAPRPGFEPLLTSVRSSKRDPGPPWDASLYPPASLSTQRSLLRGYPPSSEDSRDCHYRQTRVGRLPAITRLTRNRQSDVIVSKPDESGVVFKQQALRSFLAIFHVWAATTGVL